MMLKPLAVQDRVRLPSGRLAVISAMSGKEHREVTLLYLNSNGGKIKGGLTVSLAFVAKHCTRA
jgi:hypothetical protein